jgi:hypothetical protein
MKIILIILKKIRNHSQHYFFYVYAEAVLKFAKLNTASVASRSVCSRAKPTAYTGFGIPDSLLKKILNTEHTEYTKNVNSYKDILQKKMKKSNLGMRACPNYLVSLLACKYNFVILKLA